MTRQKARTVIPLVLELLLVWHVARMQARPVGSRLDESAQSSAKGDPVATSPVDAPTPYARDQSESLDPGGLQKHPDDTRMDEMLKSEQSRDMDFAGKPGFIPPNKSIDTKPSGIFDKHNISVSKMDDMMDSEIKRDGTLTDLSRSSADLVDSPSPLSLLKLPIGIANASAPTEGDRLRKVEDYAELVEVNRPTHAPPNVNVTAFELENDAPDTILSWFAGFTDVQTLFLACFATLAPLMLTLVSVFAIRCMYRRWCARGRPQEPSSPSHKPSPDVYSQSRAESVSFTDQEAVASGGVELSSGDSVRGATGGGTNGEVRSPANGSIITMTLKNNHLIVETEERNDIIKDGRETRMKYSPDSDGIFVVEVQQSGHYLDRQASSSSPHATSQRALVHRVDQPDNTDHIQHVETNLPVKDLEKNRSQALSCTGLSISDLSISSLGSHNPSYSYGSQIGYDLGPYGYPVYAGYEIPSRSSVTEGLIPENSRDPLITKTPSDPDKPVVTAAIFKQDSIIGTDVLQCTTYCIEGSTDGPLLSDVQAREVSLHQLQDRIEKQHDVNQSASPETCHTHQSPKRNTSALQRADTLPPQTMNDSSNLSLDANISKNLQIQSIAEDPDFSEPIDANSCSWNSKRGSLPIITTDELKKIKGFTKTIFVPPTKSNVLITAGTPTIEQEGSCSTFPPPLITVTEEHENHEYQNGGEDSH